MSGKRRMRAALALALGLALMLLLSSAYAGHGATHDCRGEGCLICEALERMVLLSGGTALFPALFLILFSCRVCLPAEDVLPFRQDTPVGLKVRMND